MRHIAALSGGLDSSVMWLYLTGHLPGFAVDGVEGVFADPGKEDPRTYSVLNALHAITGNQIKRISGPSWDEALEMNNFFFPFYRSRWCTRIFKIEPFEKYVNGEQAISYIGLRADEPERIGYLGSEGDNISPRYPLREMGISRGDVERIALEVGLPHPAIGRALIVLFGHT